MRTLPGFLAMLTLGLALSAQALAQVEPDAKIYSLRTPASTAVSIPYSTVVVPGDGQNTIQVLSTGGPTPAHGTLSYPSVYDGTPQQAFLYTPTAGYTGTDQFYFRVTDGSGDFAVGLITLNVGNFTATVGNDDIIVSTLPGTFLDVLFNDIGFADPVTFTITQQPAHGTLQVDIPTPAWQSGIGVFYTPTPGYTGPDQFQYQLGDGIDQGTATVSLTVSGDADLDDVLDVLDNCPATANPFQEDGDGDGVGDACDNCAAVVNPGQENNDGDALGNACDADDDNDTVADTADNCLYVANASQYNADGDLFGNACDADLNNSGGLVNFTDLALFRAAFGTVNAAADLNGSGGIVNFTDLALFRTLFGKVPGPSGLAP